MSMSDWSVSNSVDIPTAGWVYYVYTAGSTIFSTIHMSRNIDDPFADHMATNDRMYYYYGYTESFNTNNIPEQIASLLKQAWSNYFTV